MVDFSNELALLGHSAAVSLVQAMVSNGWEKARSLLAQLLGRGDTEEEARHERRMDRDHAAIENGTATEDKIRDQWETRLIDWLEYHPDAAKDLREILNTINAARPDSGSTTTYLRVDQKADHGSTAFTAGGDVTINHGTAK